ncbi:hypothetical protein, partial [Serratia marcescens]|uniref:hypothetical protein n=1 Tax=Serratia marcescens TaxID=615 RepID=UPI00280AEAF6
MIINPVKTKVMRVGKKPRRNMRVIRVEDKILEQVENFKYLGTHLNENGYIDSEVTGRIAAASRMFEAVKKGFLNR